MVANEYSMSVYAKWWFRPHRTEAVVFLVSRFFKSFLALLLHLQNVYFSGLKTIDILYIKIQTLKRRIM